MLLHAQTRGVAPLAGRPRVPRARASVPRASLTGFRPRVLPDAEPSTSAIESTETPRWRVALAASFVTTASALAHLWTPLSASARTAAETPAGAGASTAETRTVLPLPAARFHHLERLSSPLGVSGVAVSGARKAPPASEKDAADDGPVDTKQSLSTNERDEKVVSPAPPRRKANAFVREAASVVGPCVVRIDVDFDARDAPSRTYTNYPYNAFEASRRDVSDASGGAATRRRLVAREKKRAAVRGQHGQGCGLVIDSENGLIVTNAHVIKGRGVVRVTLADGRSVPGDVVGVDALTDIALVRVPRFVETDPPRAKSASSSPPPFFALPAAPPLGDSASLEVGDWVIALGNPFGLDNTITLGIVSNLRRTSSELGIPDRRVDFLQTDCAINPGNSGGPLVNEFGEVVAITAAVRADAEGIGFAIPVNEVRRVVGLLAKGQQVTHAHVGVRMVDVADAPGLTNTGALIVEVFPGSPAFFAGARAGDVCVAMEGELLADAAHVRRKVEALRPGEPLTLTVARGGRRLDLSMRAADRSIVARQKVGESGFESGFGSGEERDEIDASRSSAFGEDGGDGIGGRASSPRVGVEGRGDVVAGGTEVGREVGSDA